METEETSRPGRGILLTLGIVGLVLGGALAGEFVFRLQPQLGGGGGPPAGGTVVMPLGVGTNTQLNFEPAMIVLIIGTNNTVTFTNKDSATHTVTAVDHSFDSGDIKAGASWTYTFSTPGNFTYYCIYHASWMRAKVVVKQSGAGGLVTVNIPSGVGSDNTLNYVPSHITLVVGVNNTVLFINHDTTIHTVTDTADNVDSGDIMAGQSWSHTFAAGTYSFHCAYHSWMTGVIVVKTP